MQLHITMHIIIIIVNAFQYNLINKIIQTNY